MNLATIANPAADLGPLLFYLSHFLFISVKNRMTRYNVLPVLDNYKSSPLLKALKLIISNAILNCPCARFFPDPQDFLKRGYLPPDVPAQQDPPTQ